MEQIIQKYLQKGEFQKALNLLEIGKKKESNNAALNYYFGKVYFQLNDHKKSLFYFRKCNQINPDNPKILYNLAQVLQGQGKINEAKKIYEKLKNEGIETWVSRCECCSLTEDQHKLNRKTEFKIIRY